MTGSDFLKALTATVEIDLIVTGRKSGRTSSRPVWFVQEEKKLYLLPVAGSNTSWFKNILANPTIQITVQGKILTAKSIPITEQDKVKVIVEKFKKKHGLEEIKKYYTNLDVAVEMFL